MSGQPLHRLAEIDGQPVVLLAPVDFERLDTARRQLGAREARVRSQQRDIERLTAIIDQIRAEVAAAQHCDHTPGQDCLRCRLESLLTGP